MLQRGKGLLVLKFQLDYMTDERRISNVESKTNQSSAQGNPWKWAFIVLIGFIIVGVLAFMGGRLTGNVVADTPGTTTGNLEEATIDDDPMLGSEDAQVTIIAFSDYQCPFCRKFETESFPSIKENFIDTGKVRFVYRDFPLPFHAAAEISAEAAHCAGEFSDEAYWAMHDKIVAEQNILDSGSATGAVTKTVDYGAAELKQWAKSLGYDISSCLDSGKYKDEVAKDLADGQASGVQGTPTFFINGQLISGAQPYSVFESAINSALR